MVSNNFEKELTTRDFEYGKHMIVVSIQMTHERFISSDVTYGDSGFGYYRKVSVRAYPSDEYNGEIEGEADVFNRTICRVRADSIEPDIEVPDDPNLSIVQKMKTALSTELTTEDMKANIRARKRRKIQEKRVPRGPSVDISTQVEDSVRPVLETIDSQYFVMDEDIEIDIDVSIERMSAEVSWVEVDDEVERITKEMENLSEM